jgi:predicted Zn-dependent protease
VRNWSNPFANRLSLVGLGLSAALAGCHSAPPKSEPVAARVAVSPSVAVTAPSPAASPPSTLPGAPNAAGAKPSVAKGAPPTVAGPAESAPPPPAPVPERAAQQYAQALNMVRSGRKTDAELELKQLSTAYPQYAGPQLNLGLLYLADSRLNEAESAFKSALDTNPANPVAGDELGIVQRKLGKFSDAEAAYQRAIAADPNFAPAHLNLGVLYDLYLSQPQKALEQFERYLEIAGENKQVAGWVVELKKRVGATGPKKEPA